MKTQLKYGNSYIDVNIPRSQIEKIERLEQSDCKIGLKKGDKVLLEGFIILLIAKHLFRYLER